MHQVHQLVKSLARDVATPHAQKILRLLECGDYVGLQQTRVDPLSYGPDEAPKLRMDLLVNELLRKCDLETGVDKEANAIWTFHECEQQNARTNARLADFEGNYASCASDLDVLRFLDEVRQEIRLALPPVPKSLIPLFSGGATVGDGSKLSTKPDKLSNRPQVYGHSVDLLQNSFWPTRWGLLVRNRRSTPEVVKGNIFFTVPKDGTKYRGCAKEASINVGLQLAAAQELRKALSHFGIDLSTGKDKHMRLAREGSRYGHLVTIDLSNASDTLARGAVRLLLPELWYTLLNSLRATHTRVGSAWYRLEKFSSMGNGFTFELETLIFCAVARVCARACDVNPETVTVFGDDIIAPAAAGGAICSALSFLGFTVNRSKTFLDGPFRESCGGDYFEGHPVRGVYLESLPREPHEWIALHNKLAAHSLTGARAARLIKAFVPRHVWLCRGPSRFGDLVFHDHVEARWSVTRKDDPDEPTTWQFRVWRPVARVLPWYHWSPDVKFVSALIGESSKGVTPRVNGREAVSGYTLSKAWYPGSTWEPLSPLRF